MKITYDKKADAAYIDFDTQKQYGYSVNTYPCDPIELKGAQINLNINKNFVLIGIEVLDASRHLPQEVLDQAEIIG